MKRHYFLLIMVVGVVIVGGGAQRADAYPNAYSTRAYYGDPYTYGSTFQHIGRPYYQTVSHVRYIDARTFRHHVFENVIDQRVYHTGEYRRTRISGHVYTPSYRMARRMYRRGR